MPYATSPASDGTSLALAIPISHVREKSEQQHQGLRVSEIFGDDRGIIQVPIDPPLATRESEEYSACPDQHERHSESIPSARPGMATEHWQKNRPTVKNFPTRRDPNKHTVNFFETFARRAFLYINERHLLPDVLHSPM